MFWSAAFLQLSLAVLIKDSSCLSTFSLNIGQRQRQLIQPLHNYTITVDATNAWTSGNYSAFSVQVHTHLYNITITNGSSSCDVTRLCSTSGTNVGMVEILLSEGVFQYGVSIRSCGVHNSNCSDVASVSVLIAVVGVQAMKPIPGGCAQTSALEYEAAITPVYDSHSTTIYFQNSDVGFRPLTQQIPACDSSARLMENLEYHIYRQCISPGDFGENSILDVVEDLLEPTGDKSGLHAKLKYSEPKRMIFDSFSGRGIVYNVVARDTTTGLTSPYIPALTYSCELESGGCKRVIPLSTYFLGPLLGVVGLFLCFLAHRFFHIEMLIFPALIGYFFIYLTLSATTNWSYDDLVGCSVGLAVFLSLLIFILWFFTGYYYIFVVLFGLSMGGLISATLFFTPLSSMIIYLELNYIYILGFLCVAVLVIVPLVAFPVVLNIVASSVIGSYAIVFCISMFKYTQLQDILVRVVKNASIPGFLSAYSGCTFDTTDIICCCVWILLTIVGVIVQMMLYLIQKQRYKKKQQQYRYVKGIHIPLRKKYTGFPTRSLYRQLVQRNPNRGVRRQDDVTRPLLSPGGSVNVSRGASNNYGTYKNTIKKDDN